METFKILGEGGFFLYNAFECRSAYLSTVDTDWKENVDHFVFEDFCGTIINQAGLIYSTFATFGGSQILHMFFSLQNSLNKLSGFDTTELCINLTIIGYAGLVAGAYFLCKYLEQFIEGRKINSNDNNDKEYYHLLRQADSFVKLLFSSSALCFNGFSLFFLLNLILQLITFIILTFNYKTFTQDEVKPLNDKDLNFKKSHLGAREPSINTVIFYAKKFFGLKNENSQESSKKNDLRTPTKQSNLVSVDQVD